MKRLNYNPFVESAPPVNKNAVEGATRDRSVLDELEEGALATITIVAPGYGGLRVAHCGTSTEGALRLLDFLVKHRTVTDDLIVPYGVIVTQLDAHPPTGFCVRRTTDGWSLLVPQESTRVQALIQLTQAFLAVERSPLGQDLHRAGITPFRNA